MSNTIKRIIFFQKFALFTVMAQALGIRFIITAFHRTKEQQSRRYAQGRTAPGKIVTDCDGEVKRSFHQDWLAIDLVIIKDGKCVWERTNEYETLGKLWKQVFKGTWGGDWRLNDIYHFQYKGEESK